jgi:hypothetical protein
MLLESVRSSIRKRKSMHKPPPPRRGSTRSVKSVSFDPDQRIQLARSQGSSDSRSRPVEGSDFSTYEERFRSTHGSGSISEDGIPELSRNKIVRLS